MERVNAWAAVAIVVVFALFSAYLAHSSHGATADQWTRLLTLFKSFEALGFAGAGVLLGQQVARPTEKLLGETQTALSEEREKVDAAKSDARAAELERDRIATTARGVLERADDVLAGAAPAARGDLDESAIVRTIDELKVIVEQGLERIKA